VLRDNVWGPQIEDAARRDFTVNAMYYDPLTQTVVDYHGGLADARSRVLRMIGDPETRFREDPVRIVRVVRFAAKLGFGIEPATLAAIRPMASLLTGVPPSRLFDETIKLLQTGHALASLDELRKQGLDRGVFPLLDCVLAPARPNPQRDTFVRLAFTDTDRRVSEGRPVAPSFMLACMLWHEVVDRWTALQAQGEAPFPALQQAVEAVFDARIGDISGRGKLAGDMREIWLMQPRFERRTASSAAALAGQVRFRAGYDFLRLRADVGEVPTELADWWEDYHLGSDEERLALVEAVRANSSPRRPPATPRHAAPRAATAAAGTDAGPDDADDEGPDSRDGEIAPAAAEDGAAGAAPTRRRRRRRRKPAPGAAGSGDVPAA
jgi:poly(A) polymerase